MVCGGKQRKKLCAIYPILEKKFVEIDERFLVESMKTAVTGFFHRS